MPTKFFNSSGNINHRNRSKTCPKSTKNSQSMMFRECDMTIFRRYFYITAYVSEEQKCCRKKYRKISVTLRQVSALSHVMQVFDGINAFRLSQFPCVSPHLGCPNHYTKQCEQYIFIISHNHTSVYYANMYYHNF